MSCARIKWQDHLRLPLGRDEWIAFNGSTVLGDAFVEPAQGHKALIKRYSNRAPAPSTIRALAARRPLTNLLSAIGTETELASAATCVSQLIAPADVDVIMTPIPACGKVPGKKPRGTPMASTN
jgi:hypothetical protein